MKHVNPEEINYLNFMSHIMTSGHNKIDRTGIGTRSVFGGSLRFDLTDNTLPLITTKKMFIRGIIEELLFFIRGETDTKKLENKGVNIWKGNTSRKFLDDRGLEHVPEGNMGRGYGYQWRKSGNDQLYSVVESLKNDPHSRRHIVCAWNPDDINYMALPPCHCMFQFYVDSNNYLHCQMYQRSADMFLGVPFNIASYGILTNLISRITGLFPGSLTIAFGDVHVYNTHIEAISKQLKRIPLQFPKIDIKKEIDTLRDIESLTYDDFRIIGYDTPHNALSAPMAI